MSVHVTHPALGPCIECGSERVFGLQDERDGALVAVKCETCGLILSMDALRQARINATRSLTTVPATVANLGAHRAARQTCTAYGQDGSTCTAPFGHPVPLPDGHRHHLRRAVAR